MKLYRYTLTPHVICEDSPVITLDMPNKVASYMAGAFDEHPEQEQMWIVFLNKRNIVKGRLMLSLGSMDACLANPRDVLRAVLLANSAGFIMVHNHPSGDPSPSVNDSQITRLIREAAKVCGVAFLDHVIMGDQSADPAGKGFYSFREVGVL